MPTSAKSARAPRGKRTTRATTKRAKKARTYVRYDPTTGARVKVTKADPRYAAWSNRKPSKRAKLQEQILNAPGEYVAKRAKSVATTAAGHAATGVARRVAPAALGLVGRVVSSAAFAPLAGLTGAAIAAVLLQNRSVARARLALGEKVNALSRAFVAAQLQMAGEYGVQHFGDVPAEARNRLLAGYKAALTDASKATQVTQSGRFGTVTYHSTGR